jgi:hypothetical protein
VAEVYAQLQVGALVRIIPDSLPKLPKLKGNPAKVIFTADAPGGKAVAPVANSTSANKTHPSGSGA